MRESRHSRSSWLPEQSPNGRRIGRSSWLDSQLKEINIVGHRVVHGGNQFTASVLINDRVIAEIEALEELAPLHNSPAVSIIRAARAKVCSGLEWCGLKLDSEVNQHLIDAEGRISTDDSQIHAYVIPTEEGLMIAHSAIRYR